MQFIEFDSPEAMQAYLAKASEETHAGLHPEQERLTYGDYWVKFHDIDNRHIVFGRVNLPEETVASEEVFGEEGQQFLWDLMQADESALAEGRMYGWAYDRFNVEGEMGHESKVHVWPIEERLFVMAKAAGFDVANLEDDGRVLLDIAFRAMKAHVLGNQA